MKISIALLSTLTLLGCSDLSRKEESTVSIVVAPGQFQSERSLRASKLRLNESGTPDPTLVTCVGTNVKGSGITPLDGSKINPKQYASTTDSCSYPGRVSNLVDVESGGTITITVPYGSERVFELLAYRGTDCSMQVSGDTFSDVSRIPGIHQLSTVLTDVKSKAISLDFAIQGDTVDKIETFASIVADPVTASEEMGLNLSDEEAVTSGVKSGITSNFNPDVRCLKLGKPEEQKTKVLETAVKTVVAAESAVEPKAILTSFPSGTSNSTSISAKVTGKSVSAFKYKIGPSAATNCSEESGYSSEVSGSTLSQDISSISDGQLVACVLAKTSIGNWQEPNKATTTTWTKDTTAPTASIAGAPTGTSMAGSLAVTVSGTGASHYKFKVGNTASTDCTSESGYSAEAAVATNITASLASISDGGVKLCVIGRDESGNWQALSSATTASWTKDTTPPSVTITGAPSGSSYASALNVSVSGTGVSHYKFKVGASASTSCSSATGYSSETAVATAITSDLSTLSDGSVTLCVIGRDAVGNWQAESNAATATWTKIAFTGVATISGAPTGNSSAASLNITVGGSGISQYKYKLGGSSLSCSGVSGYSSATSTAVALTASLASLDAGAGVKLCVIGGDANGNFQSESSATTATWTKVCSAGYYPVSGACSAVGSGYYSTDGLTRNSCSGLPENASWSGTTSTSSDCAWSCNTDYLLNASETGCEYRPNTQAVSCPSGYVAVGAIGRSGGWMDKLGLRCRAYSNGAFSGNISDGVAYGGMGGGPFTYDCPSGSYLYRITGGNSTGVNYPESTYLANISFHCRSMTTGIVTASSGQYGSSAGVNAFDFSCGGARPISSIPFDSAGAYVGNILKAYCASELDTSAIKLTPPPPPATDLLANWSFDNNLTDSVGSYSGTANGSVAYSSSLKRYGTHSLKLNGTDAWVSTSLDLGGRSAFTIAGWFYVTQAGARIGFFGQNDLIELGMGSSPNNGRACLWVSGTSEICNSANFSLNTWVHVTLTAQSGAGGSTKLYINGTLIATNSAFSPASNSYRFSIGHAVWDPSGTGPYLSGYIDEMSAWSRALSGTEVSGLVSGGSMNFNGASDYLSVPASTDWALGTGDFTIEWFQKFQPGVATWPRVFSIGSYATSASIAVSIELGSSFYFWYGGTPWLVGNLTGLDVWTHFAITRSGSTVRVFRNGTQIGSQTISHDFNDSARPLTIGSELSSNTYFPGQIANFHWVKGTAKYTSSFTAPATPYTATANSKLLLRSLDSAAPLTDYSGTGKSVWSNGAVFSADSPF